MLLLRTTLSLLSYLLLSKIALHLHLSRAQMVRHENPSYRDSTPIHNERGDSPGRLRQETTHSSSHYLLPVPPIQLRTPLNHSLPSTTTSARCNTDVFL